MTSSAAIPPDEAAELLEHAEAAREEARRREGAHWFALVVVGVLLFVSAWFFAVGDGA